MTTSNDGGPAFPNKGDNTPQSQIYDGMSLRDYFAAEAMQALLGASYMKMLAGTHAEHENYDDVLAESAYKLADAMIHRRQTI